MDKNTVVLVQNQKSLGFFNQLFLVPKPNKWRPILDLSHLNKLLKAQKFKMETPENIGTSLQQGEWVTSIDFKDTYFHIPIQEQSRKYFKLSYPGQNIPVQSTAIRTVHSSHGVHCDSKRGELMAIHRGRRIHQYLDNCLVRARSHQVCLQHTQDLVTMCQQLDWLVNLENQNWSPNRSSIL